MCTLYIIVNNIVNNRFYYLWSIFHNSQGECNNSLYNKIQMFDKRIPNIMNKIVCCWFFNVIQVRILCVKPAKYSGLPFTRYNIKYRNILIYFSIIAGCFSLGAFAIIFIILSVQYQFHILCDQIIYNKTTKS